MPISNIPAYRRRKEVVIEREGRDKGKRFLIVEMSAIQSEEWAFRLMEALGKSGIEISDNVLAAGMAGLLAIGSRVILGAPWSITGPLWREMFDTCVHYVPDPMRPDIIRGGTYGLGPLIDEDTQEILTRLQLRMEVLELHLNFSLSAVLFQKWKEIRTVLEASSTTQTSDNQ